jgi:UDP-galactopyranose mutase
MQSMIVFSHLRWDFVYQRPQHLISRLAKHYRVFFFEEPLHTEGAARLQVREQAPNLYVCRPYTSAQARGYHDDQLPVVRQLLDELIVEQGITDPIAWLYTPMALPLAQSLAPSAMVYDCMDELSAFLNAPRQLLQRESALLKAADVVFTGGPSLYRSKKLRHDRVYCFPSSVEQDHFARARPSEARVLWRDR